MPATEAMLFVGAGLLAGFINTLASSGSAVTLPLMILVGIPAPIANGTNRLPLLVGGLSAVLTFHRDEKEFRDELVFRRQKM